MQKEKTIRIKICYFQQNVFILNNFLNSKFIFIAR